MANIYKIDNNWISSALMPLGTIFADSQIKGSPSAVNIFTSNDIALGINQGSRRIAYKHNNILFKTSTKANGTNNITFVTRPSIAKGFVQWNGTFDWIRIISDLLAIDITVAPDNVDFKIDGGAKTIVSSGSAPFTISWTDTDLMYEGSIISGQQALTAGDMEFSIDADRLLLLVNGDFSTINTVEYSAPETPYDLSYDLIDGEAGLYIEKEIVLDYSSLIFDDFGHQYYAVGGYDFGVSQSAIWFPDGSPEYLPNDQFSFVLEAETENAFAEFSKDRLRSAVNTGTLYEDGLIESSVKTYIGYARVYSSYVYVDYYYIKIPTTEDECAMLEDTVSYGRACRLKIKNTDITISNIDSSLEHVALVENAQSLAHDAYTKFRFGVGSFKSDYPLYSYRDKRDTLEVIFNRESSSKYIKVTIEDQPTRYRATILVKSGTQSSTTVKNFPRYSANALWSMGNTAYLNMILKRALDNVSDTVETLFTNSAISLDQDTIKILTRTLYVNILDQDVSFPQINLTYDTLAVVAWPSDDGDILNLQINYQPATGAIYGRIEQGSSYDYFSKDDVVNMLNSINPEYEFEMTCNISSLSYVDLDGNSQVYPFTNSTMIIAEAVNGFSGQFYRVYYKNADSYGFVLAKQYTIQE
jgi:hypothetical protein